MHRCAYCCPPQGRGVAERGYKFLLLDTYAQLWILLRAYITDAERRSGVRTCRLGGAHHLCVAALK